MLITEERGTLLSTTGLLVVSVFPDSNRVSVEARCQYGATSACPTRLSHGGGDVGIGVASKGEKNSDAFEKLANACGPPQSSGGQHRLPATQICRNDSSPDKTSSRRSSCCQPSPKSYSYNNLAPTVQINSPSLVRFSSATLVPTLDLGSVNLCL
jgi:hypothetical protein